LELIISKHELDLLLGRVVNLNVKDRKTLVERGLKTSEEVGELSEATPSSEGVAAT